jgi:hypothetical protein
MLRLHLKNLLARLRLSCNQTLGQLKKLLTHLPWNQSALTIYRSSHRYTSASLLVPIPRVNSSTITHLPCDKSSLTNRSHRPSHRGTSQSQLLIPNPRHMPFRVNISRLACNQSALTIHWPSHRYNISASQTELLIPIPSPIPRPFRVTPSTLSCLPCDKSSLTNHRPSQLFIPNLGTLTRLPCNKSPNLALLIVNPSFHSPSQYDKRRNPSHPLPNLPPHCNPRNPPHMNWWPPVA